MNSLIFQFCRLFDSTVGIEGFGEFIGSSQKKQLQKKKGLYFQLLLAPLPRRLCCFEVIHAHEFFQGIDFQAIEQRRVKAKTEIDEKRKFSSPPWLIFHGLTVVFQTFRTEKVRARMLINVLNQCLRSNIRYLYTWRNNIINFLVITGF